MTTTDYEYDEATEAHTVNLQAQLDALLLAYLTEIARATRIQRDLDFACAGWLALSEAVWAAPTGRTHHGMAGRAGQLLHDRCARQTCAERTHPQSEDTMSGTRKFASVSILLLIAVSLLMAALSTAAPVINDALYDMQHAVTKHGAEVEAVQRCLTAKGAFAHMINPVSKRTVDVCEIEPGLYGIEAHEPNGDLVTAFIDRARTSAAAVIAELVRKGWQ